jgi:hypothetical protein
MKKEKFHIEYVFDKAGKTSLWNYISTTSGLSEWFADSVTAEDTIFTFVWNNYPNKAELLAINPGGFIRFHWLEDGSEETYFEFRIHKIELTGGVSLEITDFAYPDEKEEAIILWGNEIKILKRILGL